MKFLKKTLLLISISIPLSIMSVSGQSNATQTDGTDAKSKAILDKVKKQYENNTSLESAFKIEYKLAEQPKAEVTTGRIYQQGDNFRAEMGKDFIIGNAQMVWQKVGNTVQIKNATDKDADDLLTPKALIRMYEKKEFTFGVTGESAEGWSKKATTITGKPNNRRNEFTKIVLAIDQKTNYIVSVTAFGRDQSRSKITLEMPVLNQKQDASKFTFDKSKYPNVKVEDLRID